MASTRCHPRLVSGEELIGRIGDLNPNSDLGWLVGSLKIEIIIIATWIAIKLKPTHPTPYPIYRKWCHGKTDSVSCNCSKKSMGTATYHRILLSWERG